MAPVHDAARWDDVEELQRLLDEEPGLLEADNEGWPSQRPLTVACYYGAARTVGLLLERGAAVDVIDGAGGTPLVRACEAGCPTTVAALLAHGADPLLGTPASTTLLTYAASSHPRYGSDHAAVIRLLLEDGRVAIDARNSEGYSALSLACLYGHTRRAALLLLEGRADHTITDNRGYSPFEMATWFRASHDCARLILWFEGELEKAALLSKARAVMDATESISKAPEKVGARTRGEAQRAREEAAPAWLRCRVERGEALPSVQVRWDLVSWLWWTEEEEERRAVCQYIVGEMKGDLFMELMEGLRLR